MAFGAIIYNGSPAIFLSPTPGIIVPVSLVNDPLSAMHVANFSGFGSQALNDAGQVAFSPFLSIVTDGKKTDTQAFIRADPDPNGCIALGNCQTWNGQLPPLLVLPTPEPSVLLLLITAAGSAFVVSRPGAPKLEAQSALQRIRK